MSGKDRAHNAEKAAMQEEFDRRLSAVTAPPAPANETPEAARIRELEAQVARERSARVAADMRSKYPYAAAVLGEEVANLSEPRLAAFEAGRVDRPEGGDPQTNGAGFPIIDPNSPPRRPAGMPATKPTNDLTIEETEAAMRALAPAYQASVKERTGF
jgi:hypothetical protein